MNKIIEILEAVGAILSNSHFVGTSGRHIGTYINKDLLYLHPQKAAQVGKLFAEKFKDLDIEAVVAPAIGGTVLSQWTAYYLSKYKHQDILAIYTEKDQGPAASGSESNQIFRRGYERQVKDKKVLVVEDLTTTGVSVRKVVEAVKNAGGNVLVVSVMLNRDREMVTSQTVGAPFSPLAELSIESYAETDCPLCKRGVPINTSVGHGKEFLERNIRK